MIHFNIILNSSGAFLGHNRIFNIDKKNFLKSILFINKIETINTKLGVINLHTLQKTHKIEFVN